LTQECFRQVKVKVIHHRHEIEARRQGECCRLEYRGGTNEVRVKVRQP